tara:strand:- start:24222 stop:26669 length:2448 start_codon:yes stop_codon:yes gene_type:complete
MLKNYLKIAFRNIWKNKVFSLINVLGLSIGLSASFVIGAIIYYDMTFDKFHPDQDRIYRVTSEFIAPEGSFYNRAVPVPLGITLSEQATGTEIVSRFFTTYLNKVENKTTAKAFKNIEDGVYVDVNYFKMFQYKWLAGSPEIALSNPNEVILTKKRAEKYFPDLNVEEVMGKTLVYNDSVIVKVTGIVADFDQRTDLYFKEFLSLETSKNLDDYDMAFNDKWNNTNSSTQVFVKLGKEVNSDNLQQQLNAINKEHEEKDQTAMGRGSQYHLQAFSDIHFNTNYGTFDYGRETTSKPVLLNLGLVAFFLLLLGCINFINLNTAQATKRSKEIGIRKTLGSSKKQLIFQFLGETFWLTMASALLSFGISYWLLKVFSDFIPEDLKFELLVQPFMIVLIIVLLLLVVFLSGFYPAIVLSKYKPISVLKNQAQSGNEKISVRKYLTIFQFSIAQLFIIATLLVGKQMNYLIHKDMGIKTNAIAYFRTPWNEKSYGKRLAIVNDIKSFPQVKQVTLGGSPPASTNTHSTISTFVKDEGEINTDLQLIFGDEKYRELYGIELLAGRDILNDTIKEYVINETYAKILGFKNPIDAVGNMLKYDTIQLPIVGVMKDFNQRSLHTSIQPMAMIGDWYRSTGFSQFRTVHIQLQGNSQEWSSVLKKVESSYISIYPDTDFELTFMDDAVQKFYSQEKKTTTLLKWATGLAILISCLGLFGLVIHTTERRTKEIGVRKILGASLMELNLLLCKEFLVLVLVAFLIAIPIAWYGLHYWLEGFAYKTSLSWWVFVLGACIMISIALLIMSFKTISAARTNPVKSLRAE